jgi:formylmethanofuran dehydrogenase subunit B
MTPPDAGTEAWTCPFCPLACDAFAPPRAGPAGFEWRGDPCARATGALAVFTPGAGFATPEVDGQAATPVQAVARAAQILAASRQPLFAGLGADVAGARALYPLACATGAICDASGGDALIQGLRALQDRGQYTATLAEVRERADVIVFVGGLPGDAAPLLARRLGVLNPPLGAPRRRVITLGGTASDAAELARWAASGVAVQALATDEDLFSTLRWLAGLLAPRPVTGAPPALRDLAGTLLGARYAALVAAPARLPAHGALAVEAVHQVVNHLNRSTRAAALWIGGGNGAATSNQAFAWLSGLPLRSRAGPLGLEHEPLCFGTQRLLDDHAVDALLWVSSFDASAMPPPSAVPLIVLGPPALGPAVRRPGAVFIPVATPGIGAAGHVFRTDGTVLMPLHALHDPGLPGVADVARALLRALNERAQPQ